MTQITLRFSARARTIASVVGLLVAVSFPAAGEQVDGQGPTSQAPPGGQLEAPRPKPPLPNRLNEVLPGWLRLRGEFRERVEGFSGAGFADGRDDAYALSRFRLNAAIAPRPGLAFQIQAQDARVAEKEVGSTGVPFKGPFDLRMAFADVGHATTPLAVRLGRQELAFGEQRLLGHVSWVNTARTFDAARVTVRVAGFQPGAFLKQATPGASYTQPFVMLTDVFLAEN